MSKVTSALIAVIVALIIGMWYTTSRVQSLNSDLKEVNRVAKQQQSDIDTMLLQRQQAAALDNKVTKELADARNEVDRLRIDIANGTKRLHINASCPRLPEAPTSASGSNAGSPRLNNSAQRDYLTLRERISTATTMIAGLQDYIKTQCQ
jgi:prophage endopeptidase